MKKVIIYLRYFFEYMKFGDIVSIAASIKYIINRTSHKEDRIIRTSVGTFFCRKNTNDFQFANYAYEWSVKRFILDRVSSYSVFIDAGSCVGDYSILLSQRGLRCFAFEPVADTYDVLVKNIEINNLSSTIQPFPFGLGELSNPERFIFNSINTGDSHIVRDGNPGNREVMIRTFDSVLESLNLKNDDKILFKLDVEGMEREALCGAVKFIQSHPEITFVIENTHTSHKIIEDTLSDLALFEFGVVDKYNIYAQKIKNNISGTSAAQALPEVIINRTNKSQTT